MLRHSERCFFPGKGGEEMTDNDLRKIALIVLICILSIVVISWVVYLIFCMFGMVPIHRYLYFFAGILFGLFLKSYISSIKDIYKDYKKYKELKNE
jgi:CHASE2 domain-containing sensor protein